MSQSSMRYPIGAGRPERPQRRTPPAINRGDLSPESQMPYRWPRTTRYPGGLSHATVVWATAAGMLMMLLVALLVMMSNYRW